MIDNAIFITIIVGVFFFVIYLLKTRNDITPDMPEPPQDHIINYQD